MWGLDRKEGRLPKNWCLRPVVIDKTLESPFTAKKSNQSSLKEVNPEYSLERLMLKLKLQYFGHLMWIANSLEKTLMLEKIEGRSRRGRQWMRWLDGITNSLDMSGAKSGRYWRTGKPGVLQSMKLQRARHTWVTEQQQGGSDSSRDDLVSGLHDCGLGARLHRAWLIYNVAVVSAVQQSESVYIYICLVSFRFFCSIDHYRVLSRVSCAVQEVRITCLFYI